MTKISKEKSYWTRVVPNIMTSVLTRKTNTNTDRQERCCLALDAEPSVKGCVPRQAGTAGTHKKA